MIWLGAVVLAVLAMAPLGWVALRRRAAPLDRQAAALVLHRDQMSELDRDLADARIDPAEHATAVLEVQRRLLATGADPAAAPQPGSRTALVAVLALVPAFALGLYLLDGRPDLPAAPMAARVAAARARNADLAQLSATLRTGLAALDPNSPQARQGYVLLGSVETDRSDFSAAAAAWKTALAAGFDPALAARTAETLTAVAGRVTPEAADLFRRALDAAPPGVPWRALAEARLAEAR